MTQWVDTPEGWERVANRLRREADRGEMTSVDAEFQGVNIKKESPVARAELVCWSVAVFDGRKSPRGYRRATGIGLPRAAIDHPGIRAWLESTAPKVAHNSPAEAHSFGNAGVTVRGLINSLNLARFMIPGRKVYGLDALGEEFLGVGKAGSWKDFVEPNIVTVTRHRTAQRCSCGDVPCRKKSGPFHTREKVREEWPEAVVRGTKPVDQRLLVPGHPMFDAWLRYIVRDAELALSLWDYLRGKDREVVTPWRVSAPPSFRDLWAEEAA